MSDRSLSSLGLPITTLSALERLGYDTVSDLSKSTPEGLSRDLNIPLPASQAIFYSASRPTTTPVMSMTQSVASMMGNSAKRYSTSCDPLDQLLEGGLKCGHVLEISGPPGCGKDQMAARTIKSFIQARDQVLFVDMQNMVPPATIKRILLDIPAANAGDDSALDLVHYKILHTPTEFVVFIRTLPAYLAAHPSIRLVVLNSFTFPFQTITDYRDKAALLDRTKETLTRLCASSSLTVIITSQLVSQPLNCDEPGNAPQGSPFIMKRTFDDKYYPPGRTYRVLVVPKWPPERPERETGVIRLLSTPANAKVPSSEVQEVKYRLLGGVIQGL